MPSSALSREPAPLPFYFRVADRMRIEACVSAVAQEGMSLALSCEREALLDHYFDLLLARLKEVAPQHRIDVYFPSNTESLLARFNEILAEQSLSQAFQSVPVAEKALLWIVHDAQSLPAQEIQLLARLIQNLPGANIRAILLLQGPGRQQTSLSTFGRRIVRWDIDVPNAEQAVAALEQAKSLHCEARVRQLLGRLGHAQPAQDEAEPVVQPDAAPPPSARPAATDAPGGAAASKLAATPRSRLPAVLAVLALFAAATLLTLWMQPEAFDQARDEALVTLQRLTDSRPARPQPISPPAPEPIPLEAVPAAATVPPPPPELPSGTAPPSGTTPPPSTLGAAAQPVAGLPGAAETTTRAITFAPQPAAVAPAPRPAIKAPDAQAWLDSLDPKAFMVQSGSLPTRAQAEQLQAAFPDLAQARILNAWRKTRNDPVFLVVSGPYPSLPHAQQVLRSLRLPPGSWIRTAISVQEQTRRPAEPR